MNKIFKTFILFWIVIFILSFFTAKAEITIIQRVGYTMALSAVAPLLLLSGKGNHQTGNKNTYSVKTIVYEPNSRKVIYRVSKDGKIYREMEKSPVYVIKGDKIYDNLSSKFVYRIEADKIYKGMEVAPFFEIKNNKVCHVLSNNVVYDIKYIPGEK